jgi:hypothetical protein
VRLLNLFGDFVIIIQLVDEFAEYGTQLIRSHNKTNAHTQNASEGPRADKFTSDNAKGLRDPLFEVKHITDHSHNIRAPSSANSSIQLHTRLYSLIHVWIVMRTFLLGNSAFM